MKKLFLAVLAVFTLSSCSDGLVTAFSTGDLITPDHSYEVDTWGTNSEVYEFTSRANPNVTCVFVMLDSGSAMGLQCFNK